MAAIYGERPDPRMPAQTAFPPYADAEPERDPWKHRSSGMRCSTCMFFVEKEQQSTTTHLRLGRCRRHAPTMSGYPAVFPADWCGDHKLDETKL